MKIAEIFKNKGKTVFSFEVFPPKKTSPIESVYSKLEEICTYGPDFSALLMAPEEREVTAVPVR